MEKDWSWSWSLLAELNLAPFTICNSSLNLYLKKSFISKLRLSYLVSILGLSGIVNKWMDVLRLATSPARALSTCLYAQEADS